MNFRMFIVFSLLFFASCNLIKGDDIDIIPTPILKIPLNYDFVFFNDTAIAFSQQLRWNGSPYTNNYRVEIAEDENFNLNLQTFNTSIFEEYEFISEVIRDTTQYFWRVKAFPPQRVDYEESLYSEVFTFTVGVPDEIFCYKCGVYNCVSQVSIVGGGFDTVYQDIPFTVSVVRQGNTNQFSVVYNLGFDFYNLSTSVDAQDLDDVYKSTLPGSFYIGTYIFNNANLGLTQIESNWSFLNDPEISGELYFTEISGNRFISCSFTGSK